MDNSIEIWGFLDSLSLSFLQLESSHMRHWSGAALLELAIHLYDILARLGLQSGELAENLHCAQRSYMFSSHLADC